MAETWLKVYHRLLEWEWYSDTYCVRVFLHLLLTAHTAPWRYRGEAYHAGTLLTSVDALSEELKVSPPIVCRTLKRLAGTGDIDIKRLGNFGSMVTICHWRKWQTNVRLTDTNEPCNIENAPFNEPCNIENAPFNEPCNIENAPPRTPYKVDDNNITLEEITRPQPPKIEELQPLPFPPTRYPTLDAKGVAQVKAAARLAGHIVTDEDAAHFISHYAAQSWRGANGQMLDWRFKIVEWAINNKKEINKHGNQSNEIRGGHYVDTDFSGYESSLG